MSSLDWIPLLCLLGLTGVLTPLLGGYIVLIYQDTKPIFGRWIGKAEHAFYKILGINPAEEMTWQSYVKAIIFLNLWGILFFFLIQVLQYWLPFNPQSLPSVPWVLALNSAISFVTNTNWQAYSGEVTYSYFTQMAACTTQNFVSASTGMAVLFALIRGITRKSTGTLGNFWVDLTRTIIYLLLPLSFVFAVLLSGQGVVQTLSRYQKATTVEGASQYIPLGPAASQVAIKQLGSNGGGFFGANSAHPFENPTPLSNFLELVAIILIPAASFYTFGASVGSKSQGWLLFTVMFILWLISFSIAILSELSSNNVLNIFPVLEGIETRFGLVNTLLWVVSTTGTSNGSVNGAISSLQPIAGGMAMLDMMLEEVIFGGVGTGPCRMLFFVILTVFIAGLMIGRTPEYLGKKIEKREIQWVMAGILLPSAFILIGSSLAILSQSPLSSLSHKGPHGLTELIYAFTSASGNNGSSFAGLNSNTNFFNLSLGLIMLLSRFTIIIPTLAFAGLLAAKKTSAKSIGTLQTDTPLFMVLLTLVILIIGTLTFFPAISLGPVVEKVFMDRGQPFG